LSLHPSGEPRPSPVPRGAGGLRMREKRVWARSIGERHPKPYYLVANLPLPPLVALPPPAPLMSTHASVLVDSVGPPSAEVCRAAASFP
jgi:hypothetical protein